MSRSPHIRYVGTRDGNSPPVVLVHDDESRLIVPLHHVIRHSPTGMEWGYGGSGPSDLALSILADHLGMKEVSPRLYHAFKFDVVAHFEESGFVLSAAEVQAWLAKRWASMSEEDIREDLGTGVSGRVD